MRNIRSWVLAATLVCGASVFTACSNDNADNAGSIEQAKKNRKEFVAHTRATLKDLAENLNFMSWIGATNMNMLFNQNVLNNPEFNKSVLAAFMQKMQQSVKPVEEGSELAAMGYKMYGTVDFTAFNYRFTMNAESTGFDVEEADDFEVILNGLNGATQQVESGNCKLTLKAGGSTSCKFVRSSSLQPGLALVIVMPSEFQFAISDKFSGIWHDSFKGTFSNQVDVAAGHEYAEMARDTWSVNGTVSSNLPGMEWMGEIRAPDAITLNFSIANNREDNTGDYAFSWEQNGRKMIDLTLKQSRDASGGIANIDLSQFTSASSILDVFAAWLATRSLDEAKLTLLDDLTTTLSISNMAKALEVAREGAAARRNYADEATIDHYTQQLNQLVSAKITCKGVNQEIPMRLATTKLGVDWWTMPAFNFADENGYVSFVDLLDSQSVAYGINIIDHAAAPMQQSMIVVRQLLQYLQGLVSGFQQQNKNEKMKE